MRSLVALKLGNKVCTLSDYCLGEPLSAMHFKREQYDRAPKG